VEMIPDLVRTVGNVTMDVAATTAIARMSPAAGDGETEAAEAALAAVAEPLPAASAIHLDGVKS